MRHPDCTHDPVACRIVSETKVSGKEVRDGYGRVVKPLDTHELCACDTCGLSWTVDDGVVSPARGTRAAPAQQTQSQAQHARAPATKHG